MEGEHIKGSPFAVSVRSLGIPMKIIGDVKQPVYIAVDKTSNVIVTEGGRKCISVLE